MAAHVPVRVNDVPCRGIMCSEIAPSFCALNIANTKLALKTNLCPAHELPQANTSDGTPIEFVGWAWATLEIGPCLIESHPLYVASDCPADVFIGGDLLQQIGAAHGGVTFKWNQRAVMIGTSRLSMLEPTVAEQRHVKIIVERKRPEKLAEVVGAILDEGGSDTSTPTAADEVIVPSSDNVAINIEKALEKNGSSNQEIVNPDDEEPAVEREAAVEVEASEVAPDTVVAVDPNLLEAKSGENDEQPVENGGALESDAKEEDGQASPLVDGEEVILATGVADDEGGGGGNNDNIRLGAELAGPKGVELDVEEMPDDD